jgi:sporulation integral membrane protein YtvI
MERLIKLATFALIILLIGLFAWIGLYLLPFVAPFLITLTLAVLIEPVNQFLMRWKRVSRAVAVFISNTLFLLILLGIMIFGGIKIVLQLIALLEKIPAYLPNIERDALNLVQQIRDIYSDLPANLVRSINDGLTNLFGWGQTMFKNMATFLIGLVSSIPGFLILLLIMVITFILMSYYLPKIREQFLDLFSEQAQKKVNMVLNDLNDALIGFVRAHFILSSITYIITLSGLMILGVKYALAIALLIVIVDILPILGTGSFIVPWAIYSFFHGDKVLAIGLIILFIVITVVRRIIEPKVLGGSIGLGPIATIISLYLGYAILGGMGIFLGPILFIVVKSVYKAGMIPYKIHF